LIFFQVHSSHPSTSALTSGRRASKFNQFNLISQNNCTDRRRTACHG